MGTEDPTGREGGGCQVCRWAPADELKVEGTGGSERCDPITRCFSANSSRWAL